MKSNVDAMRLPPDFSKSALPAVSISEKIEAALDAGELTPEQGTVAYTRLAALNSARAGNLPMGQVLEQLKGSGTPDAVRNLFGITVTPAQVHLH